MTHTHWILLKLDLNVQTQQQYLRNKQQQIYYTYFKIIFQTKKLPCSALSLSTVLPSYKKMKYIICITLCVVLYSINKCFVPLRLWFNEDSMRPIWCQIEFVFFF